MGNDALALYEKLVAMSPDVERKGKAMPYTSRNGHMFSFLAKNGAMSLRLAETDREAFLKKHKTKLSEQHGRVMKEYVLVPASLLKNTRTLKKYFDASYAYVGSLKPKPTTRKKKATSKKATSKKAKTKKKAKKKAKKKSKK